MVNHLQKLLAVLLFLLITFGLKAQQNLTLFLMHDVPQASFVNPAVQSRCPIVVGIPGLSSLHLNYNNTAFSANEIMRHDAATDSTFFDPGQVISDMNNKELIETEFHYSPIYAGFWVRQNYFTLSVTEKVSVFNTIPKEIAQLAWFGNTRFTGEEAKFNGLRVNAFHYREYAVGLSRQVDNGWTIGGRLNFLFGKGNIYTPRTTGGLTTNARNFGLTVDLESKVKMSFPVEVELDDEGYVSGLKMQDDIDWMAYMMNKKNLGLSVDIGVIYEKDDETTWSASLLNLGAISWKTDVHSFESDGTFEFTGTDPTSDFHNSDFADELVDSIRHQFIPVPGTDSYTTLLAPELYVGVTHKYTNHIKGGAVLYNRFYRNKWHPALTLSANTFGYKKLNGSVSYSAMNGDWFNVGAGIGLKLGAFHLHTVSDNVLGFFSIADQRNLNLRFGLSIKPGCGEPKEKKPLNKRGISALPCYRSPYNDDVKKGRKYRPKNLVKRRK